MTLGVGLQAWAGETVGGMDIKVIDGESEDPLEGAVISLEDHEELHESDASGWARVQDLEPGWVVVDVEREDYRSATDAVEVVAGRQVQIEFALAPEEEGREREEDGDYVVRTVGRSQSPGEVYRPTTLLAGRALQRQMTSSVPGTLDRVPGFDVQYNGPAASSPTVRGLPGDRVLMLEDGHRTGDIYWTASDHGVMVEPISAETMEVVRGPAGLLFGSNALGGVVNVIRNDIPDYRPHEVEGRVRTQYESVNHGFSGGAVMRGGLGPLAVYGEASARRSGDTRTPEGTLEQTNMQGLNAGVGASWHPTRGRVGAAFRYYDMEYGVPGEFQGNLIPGGHPGGVDIEARRVSGRMLGEYHRAMGPIDGIDVRANLVHYDHEEIEGLIGGERAIGASFDQWTSDSRVVAFHEDREQGPLLLEGAVGLTAQTRWMEAGGSQPGTRSGEEIDVGVFGYEEAGVGDFRFQAGLRYDQRWVSTDDTSPLVTQTEERNIVKEVDDRELGAWSGSVAGLWDFMDQWTVGASVARSFRHPTIEELYSDGPHLADFSYDIGEPALSTERGWGGDLFVRSEQDRLNLEVAGFYNRIDDYISYDPTGESVRVIRDGAAPRQTPVFEARNSDVEFYGAEGMVEWEFYNRFVLDTTVSYTRAARRDSGEPLAFIPPLSGKLDLRYEGRPFFGSIGVESKASQNRVPDPVEIGDSVERPQETTDGYTVAHAMLGWRHDGERMEHSVMLQGRNITDRTTFDHMSRIKEVAPQPGLNIQLTYQGEF